MTQPVRAFVVASLLAAAAAHADFIVDQSNLGTAPSGTTAVGSFDQQRLAQTFTVGRSGQFAKVRLPIGCSSGTLRLDIVAQTAGGLPEGPLLRRTEIPAASIPWEGPAPPPFIDLFLVSPLSVTAGDQLAIVLSNETGSCGITGGTPGQSYGAGEGYFISLTNPPEVWVEIDFGGGIPGAPSDFPFQTLMEVDGSGSPPCNVWGVPSDDPLPIPANLPICRCLRDEGLHEFRCTLMSPDFFAIRRIPWPLELDESYTETWEVLSLTEFVSLLDLDLERFDAGNPIKLSFTGKKEGLDTRKVIWPAITKAFDVPGSARFTYGKDSWTIDTTIPAAQFDDGQGQP